MLTSIISCLFFFLTQQDVECAVRCKLNKICHAAFQHPLHPYKWSFYNNFMDYFPIMGKLCHIV